MKIVSTKVQKIGISKLFSGYDTSTCCSRIRVTLNPLNGVVKDKQGSRAGTYQKASELINNRSYWNQIDGNNALWWDIITNVWMIGSSSNLGSDTGGIHSAQDSACPTSDNLFKYYDGDEWNLAPINSFSIQCV